MWIFPATTDSLHEAFPGWVAPEDALVVATDVDETKVRVTPVADAARNPDLSKVSPQNIRGRVRASVPWIDLGPIHIEGLAETLGLAGASISETLAGPANAGGAIFRFSDALAQRIGAIHDVKDAASSWFDRFGYPRENVTTFELMLAELVTICRQALDAHEGVFMWTGRTT